MLLEDSPGAWQLSWEPTVGWAPTSQADRRGRVSQLPRGRKGRWEVTREQGAPRRGAAILGGQTEESHSWQAVLVTLNLFLRLTGNY